MQNVLTTKRTLIFSILSLAFLLRFTAVWFGLPHLYHADEPIVINHALAYGTGDFNPHFFKIPPLVSYFLFLAYGLYFAAGYALHFFNQTSDIELLFYTDPTSFYLIARIMMGVCAGTVTVYLFYRLIANYFSRAKAIMASFFLAVCFLHVRDSHYAYVDIPLILVMILAFGAFFKLEKKGDALKTHLISGALIGLAAAVKYNGLALVIPYFFMSFFSAPRKKVILFWFVAACACSASYLILNPYTLIDFKFFISEVRAESAAHTQGSGWLGIVNKFLVAAYGLPLLGACIAGLLYRLLKRDIKISCLGIFIFGYYVIIGMWGQPYARYTLPMIAPMLFFAADVVVEFSNQFGMRRKLVMILLGLALSATTLVQSVLFDGLMLRKDVRTLAREWIERNIPAGSKIATDLNFYMPNLRFAPDQIEEKIAALRQRGPLDDKKIERLHFLRETSKTNPAYWLYGLTNDLSPVKSDFSLSKPKVPFELSALKNLSIDYVITVRCRESDWNQAFYDALDREAELVAQFNPYRNHSRVWPYTHPITGGPYLFRDIWQRERNGQPLRIYRLRKRAV